MSLVYFLFAVFCLARSTVDPTNMDHVETYVVCAMWALVVSALTYWAELHYKGKR